MTIRTYLSLVVLTAALVITGGGCSDNVVNIDAPEDVVRTAEASGVVVLLDTGEPVAGATVQITGTDLSAVTDLQGVYRIAGIEPGEYDFLVRADDCLPVVRSLMLSLPEGAEPIHYHFDFGLPGATQEMSLRVVSAVDYEPVAGVPVTVTNVLFPTEYRYQSIAPEALGRGGVTDAEGRVVVAGLPAWPVQVWFEAMDLDGDGEYDLSSGYRSVDLSAAAAGPRLVVLAPVGVEAPQIDETNVVGYSELLADAVLYLEFDRPMLTDPGVAQVTAYPLESADYRVRWTSDRRLEIRANHTLSDMIELRVHAYTADGIGAEFYWYFEWRVTDLPTGDCADPVTDLVVDSFPAHFDYDARTFELAWSAVPCAENYVVYARDGLLNRNWLGVGWLESDFDSGTLRSRVTLPAGFDRFLDDERITPLAGVALEMCVVPANADSAAPGSPHAVVSIVDEVAPAVEVLGQDGLANNPNADPVPLDLVVAFSEYVDTTGPAPVLEMREAGGDPDFVLDPATAVWQWDAYGGSGRFRFQVAAGQDASGDEFRVTFADLTDLSGNAAGGPIITEWHPLQGTYFFDFEDGDEGWTVAGVGWERGVPTVGPISVPSGARCWGTVLGGDYANSTYTELISPELTLEFDQPMLTFQAWIYSEYCCDRLYLDIDTGSGWVSRWHLEGTISTWNEYSIDLTAYRNQRVRLRYLFRSDGSVTGPGAYIDAVRIGPGN